MLTEYQGEQLGSLEIQLGDTNNVGEDGNENFADSLGFQGKIRKKLCWTTLIVSIAIVVLVLVLFRGGRSEQRFSA